MICFTLSLILLSTTAPSLTVGNILTAVQGVAWKTLGEELIEYRGYNFESCQLNYPKLDEIERQHQSDDSRLCAVIECWLQGEGKDWEPSWRALIWRLDSAEATKAADTIRHLAEPLPGNSCDSITFLYSVCLTPDSVHTNSRCVWPHVYVCRPLFSTTSFTLAAIVLKLILMEHSSIQLLQVHNSHTDIVELYILPPIIQNLNNWRPPPAKLQDQDLSCCLTLEYDDSQHYMCTVLLIHYAVSVFVYCTLN